LEKLREEKGTWEAEKKDLQGRLNEVLSQAELLLQRLMPRLPLGSKRRPRLRSWTINGAARRAWILQGIGDTGPRFSRGQLL